MFKKSEKKAGKIIVGQEEKDEVKIVTKIPVKRHRGISFTEIEENNEKASEHENFMRKIFVKPNNELEALREKHMEKYINGKLKPSEQNEWRKAGNDEFSEEALYEIPEKYRSDNSRFSDGAEKTLWKSGLMEVPLSIKHKLDNIERTEIAKRKAIKDVNVPDSRFMELHEEEYERFNQLHSEARKEAKIVERLEKRLLLKGKRLKEERKERSEMNRLVEESWK
ncbi:unnamed protein product [Blepharisma stoltei]|uniref:Uncharacterized protein n=1 Tax=Blepharisma stoltei TaxID=1481888 RepID=A0AAU9KRY5_9CILI|nr:unnamed protein product [Blepharisma stoltei]